ncbi:MAG: hypothetical protein JOZ14_02545 [Acidobacteria bacterium]|nr:hypothetical protein [Acidobacteriota bacterium]
MGRNLVGVLKGSNNLKGLRAGRDTIDQHERLINIDSSEEGPRNQVTVHEAYC